MSDPNAAFERLLGALAPEYVARLQLRADDAGSRSRLVADLANKVAERFIFSADELRACDTFDLLVQDGGGFLASRKLIGSNRDSDVAAAVADEQFWSPMGGLGDINWNAYRRERRVEESVWLHRWYYQFSLARMYFVTRDPQFSELFRFLYTDWISKNPPPAADAPASKPAQHWFDMQLTWRVIAGVWCLRLLADCRELDADFWIGWLDTWHTAIALLHAEDERRGLRKGNHQLHISFGLALGASVLREFAASRQWWDFAVGRMADHLREFDADHYSEEISPSYSAFVIQQYRDVAVMGRKTGWPLSPQIPAVVEPATRALLLAMQPDRTLVPLADAYSLDARPFVALTSERMGFSLNLDCDDAALPRVQVSRGVGLACLRSNGSRDAIYAMLDFSSPLTGHWHGGKLGLVVSIGQQPFLVDAGVGDYCVSEFAELRAPEAHNTLMVDGRGDSLVLPGRPWGWVVTPTCRLLDSGSRDGMDLVAAESVWPQRQGVVQHRRAVGLVGGAFLVVVDRVVSLGEHEFAFPLHLAPMQIHFPPDAKTVQASGTNGKAELVWLDELPMRLWSGNGKLSLNGTLVQAPVVGRWVDATNAATTAFAIFDADRKPDNAMERARQAVALLTETVGD